MLRQAGLRRTEGSTARSVQPSPVSGVPLRRPGRTAPADRAPGQASRPSRRIVAAGITPHQPLAAGHSDRLSGAKAQFKTMFPVKPAASVACCRGRLAEPGAGCRTHPQHPRARHRSPPAASAGCPSRPSWPPLGALPAFPVGGLLPGRLGPRPARPGCPAASGPGHRPARRDGPVRGPGQPRCTPARIHVFPARSPGSSTRRPPPGPIRAGHSLTFRWLRPLISFRSRASHERYGQFLAAWKTIPFFVLRGDH